MRSGFGKTSRTSDGLTDRSWSVTAGSLTSILQVEELTYVDHAAQSCTAANGGALSRLGLGGLYTRMLHKFFSLFTRSRRDMQPRRQLRVSDVGLTLLQDDEESWSFRWEEISRIETYKRDLFTVDIICVDFFVSRGPYLFPVHDEVRGFDVLCRDLHVYFPSVDQGWWSRVTFPAFQTNHTVLYEHPTGTCRSSEPT